MYGATDEDIEEIERWVATQRFLPKDLSKPFICTFLRGCEGDISKTKKVIGNYFYARQSIPELFFKRDPLLKENILSWKASFGTASSLADIAEEIRKVPKSGFRKFKKVRESLRSLNPCFVPLKGHQDGCKIFLGTALNSETYDFVKFAKQVFMCYDLLIKNNEWGNGDRILVISYDKIRFENLGTYTIYITRKTSECERDNYLPGKLKAVHNVHIPPFMRKIHERFQPFLKPEDEKLIYFHKNLKSLHKAINPNILPLEFGGKAGPLKNIIETWCEILKAHRSFFLQEEEKRMKEVKLKVGVADQLYDY